MNKITAFPRSLRQDWHGDSELSLISHHNIDERKALLAKAHKDFYAHYFPMSEGGEDLDRWLDNLEDADSNFDYRIIVAGRNLADPEKAEINGISVSIYFRDNDTGLLAYIAVDPNKRVNGLGHALYDLQARELFNAARENGKKLSGWFVECYAPEVHPVGFSGYDSQKLVDKYVGWGCKRLPIDYVVPGVEDNTERQRDLTLLAGKHPVRKTYPTNRTVFNYIRNLWSLEGVSRSAQENDPAMYRMAHQLLPAAEIPQRRASNENRYRRQAAYGLRL